MEGGIPKSCPGTDADGAGRASGCAGCPNQKLCASGVKRIDPAINKIKNRLCSIKHKIAVMSCKGGVGKTSIAVQLAHSLARDPSKNVGLLDTDITGPSLPVMLGLQGHKLHVSEASSELTPVYLDINFAVVSSSFLLKTLDTAIIWRGPNKNELIKEFLSDVDWADTEYLIVDTPPGTTDEHFALQRYLNETVQLDGAILVTTPHESSLDSLRKVITLCVKFNIFIIGVIENMACFCCPKCEECSELFGPLGITKEICAELSVPFLGSIPVEGGIAQACDEGNPYYNLIETSPAAQKMDSIFRDVQRKVSRVEDDLFEVESTNALINQNSSNDSAKKTGDNSAAEIREVPVVEFVESTSIKNVVMVMSGKGGVGKTTVSVQLALALKNKGFKVGLMDADVCSPSVPTVLGLKDRDVYSSEYGWVPVYYEEDRMLAVMSTGFLMSNKNDAFIWRGPKKTNMIKQFMTDVCWGPLDYLVVDTPPGTSDEPITCLDAFKEHNVMGTILVTSPQGVSLADVRREVTYCKKTGTKIIGVLENLSGYICPKCSEITNIFSKLGGQKLAEYFEIPFMGCIHISADPSKPMEEFDHIVDKYLLQL